MFLKSLPRFVSRLKGGGTFGGERCALQSAGQSEPVPPQAQRGMDSTQPKPADKADKRDLAARRFPKREYGSLEAFFSNTPHRTELSTIWFNDTPADIVIQYKSESLPLFVFFHGAVDQSKTIIPHFVGLSYGHAIQANSLHFSEPSLIYSNNVRAGWYLGCRNIRMQHVMRKIVLHLAAQFGAKKIIFFGSSGGGFPALYLSQVVPGSLAIVNSPATSVLHHPRRATSVKEYLEAAFGADTWEKAEYILRECTISDMREGFNLDAGSVLYLLNTNDYENITEHARPFFAQFSEKADFAKKDLRRIGNIRLMTDNWGRGHRYPPAQFLKNVFALVCNESIDWTDEGFDAALSALQYQREKEIVRP